MRRVNVFSTKPISEFAWLAGELVLLVVGVYLGLVTDLVAKRIPVGAENWLGNRSRLPMPLPST